MHHRCLHREPIWPLLELGLPFSLPQLFGFSFVLLLKTVWPRFRGNSARRTSLDGGQTNNKSVTQVTAHAASGPGKTDPAKRAIQLLVTYFVILQFFVLWLDAAILYVLASGLTATTK